MSEGKASKDPIKISLNTLVSRVPDDNSIARVNKLILSAIKAIDQRRLKQCMVLVEAALRIDPDNKDAQALRVRARKYLDQDLAQIRALINEVDPRSHGGLYSRAETTLRAILDVDPENDEAKKLLLVISLERDSQMAVQQEPAATPRAFDAPASEAIGIRPQFVRRLRYDWIGLLLGVLILFGSAAVFWVSRSQGPATDQTSLQTSEVQPVTVGAPAPTPSPVRTPAKTLEAPPAQAPERRSAPSGSGALALTSHVPVDVYLRDRYLGPTPITIDLAPGLHTLEFRYQDFRKMASYMIKRGGTTKSTITFEATLQINSDPSAEVFVDGDEPKLLGQTPLAEVVLPVGSVLVFRNPAFAEKRYQISGKEKSVQVVFP